MSASFSVQRRTEPAPCRMDGDALAAWLRRRFRRTPTWHVASRTGIPEATVKNWLMRRCDPSAGHLLRLTKALGLEVLEVAFGDDPPDELVAAAQNERLRALDAEIAVLAAEREKLSRGGA